MRHHCPVKIFYFANSWILKLFLHLFIYLCVSVHLHLEARGTTLDVAPQELPILVFEAESLPDFLVAK